MCKYFMFLFFFPKFTILPFLMYCINFDIVAYDNLPVFIQIYVAAHELENLNHVIVLPWSIKIFRIRVM